MVTDDSLRMLTDADRPTVERLGQLYKHDLSEFRGTQPDADGLFKPGRLPGHFADPATSGYLISRNGAQAGLVFVQRVPGEIRTIGDFFVVRGLRRQGVGHAAALAAFARHPGRWELAFQEENSGAARFWRKVVTQVAGTAWTQERRAVPGKPAVPPDTWLLFSV
jgi:predicted acetyltransferase